MTTADGWTREAVALVDRAVLAHGGWPAWQAAARIRLPFRHGSGPLLALKGFGRTFPAPREYEVLPHERTTIFHDYPDEGTRGLFVNGDVRLERTDTGAVKIISRDHRRTLAGLAAYRRWSPLDALYFFGYALWHYHVVPFTLRDAHLVRVLKRGGIAHGVDIVFPAHVHTHCQRQQFYFGNDGRIIRHDYVADVLGAWARGAHFWEDYVRCEGLLLARRRRVLCRLGSWALPVPVLSFTLGDPVVSRG